MAAMTYGSSSGTTGGIHMNNTTVASNTVFVGNANSTLTLDNTGELRWANNHSRVHINGLADPVSLEDAANKKYVDETKNALEERIAALERKAKLSPDLIVNELKQRVLDFELK